MPTLTPSTRHRSTQGHYKLWAWQHTEYNRIQVLDADVLPLVNMDALFDLPIASKFIGCPGKDSVLNAGWFSLRPDCETFKRMTDLLWYRGMRRPRQWDMSKGWGVPMPAWTNALGREMNTGWDFFDARGNQGHMYAYFRFFARDLVLFYPSQVVRYTPTKEAVVSTLGDGSDLSQKVWAAFPCPFFQKNEPPPLAYYHFTGNKKPWSKYDPSNAKFAEWYAALGEAGVDAQSLFN